MAEWLEESCQCQRGLRESRDYINTALIKKGCVVRIADRSALEGAKGVVKHVEGDLVLLELTPPVTRDAVLAWNVTSVTHTEAYRLVDDLLPIERSDE
jgi:hypothetical protein